MKLSLLSPSTIYFHINIFVSNWYNSKATFDYLNSNTCLLLFITYLIISNCIDWLLSLSTQVGHSWSYFHNSMPLSWPCSSVLILFCYEITSILFIISHQRNNRQKVFNLIFATWIEIWIICLIRIIICFNLDWKMKELLYRKQDTHILQNSW